MLAGNRLTENLQNLIPTSKTKVRRITTLSNFQINHFTRIYCIKTCNSLPSPSTNPFPRTTVV